MESGTIHLEFDLKAKKETLAPPAAREGAPAEYDTRNCVQTGGGGFAVLITRQELAGEEDPARHSGFRKVPQTRQNRSECSTERRRSFLRADVKRSDEMCTFFTVNRTKHQVEDSSFGLFFFLFLRFYGANIERRERKTANEAIMKRLIFF